MRKHLKELGVASSLHSSTDADSWLPGPSPRSLFSFPSSTSSTSSRDSPVPALSSFPRPPRSPRSSSPFPFLLFWDRTDRSPGSPKASSMDRSVKPGI
ncbi:hypothetical protein EYF80_042288 [Liparis tanakae]|uniref:Uncharacterized protein n=1 Tax=Liparis tanakae TaxID=230148 RepID=A0A4Z2G2L2_9TELE|nr:hypothetical protein EYF80_042288 [Liparis tanakae]